MKPNKELWILALIENQYTRNCMDKTCHIIYSCKKYSKNLQQKSGNCYFAFFSSPEETVLRGITGIFGFSAAVRSLIFPCKAKIWAWLVSISFSSARIFFRADFICLDRKTYPITAEPRIINKKTIGFKLISNAPI